ncbi:MAG: DHHW family protein [Ruminococcus sp.]|nr:DHHW family protein [Ruminococcus sp.]
MTSKSKYIISVIFVAFIGIFAVLFWVLPKSDFSPKEKRYLQGFPEISVQSLTDGTFETDFENYINDHMVLRDVFMGVNSYSNIAVLNNGSDGVYKCSDGYLINEPATDSRLDLNLSVTADFKDKTGIDTTVMIVPSTGYIMEDKLPLVHKNYNDDRYYNRIESFCQKNGLGFVDLRDTFNSHKNSTQIYYKTDHHWTTVGAYLAYQSLCEKWGIEVKEKNGYIVEKTPDFYGTTYNTSGFWLNESDTIEVWKNRDNHSTCEITANGKTTAYKSMFFPKQLEGADKYTVFLNGNNPVTTVKNPDNKGKEKLLVIKDSFSHCLAPFLSEKFSQITLVDMRYYKKSVSEEIVKKDKFDKVLICMSMDNFLEDKDFAFLE